MHVGHGRGAVVGDALAALLAKAGFAVHREYYINDAGAQVDVLARSAYLRYREALGEAIGPIPEGFYPGEYLVETGRALAERDGDKWLGRPEAEWLRPVRDFAVAADDGADPRRSGRARRALTTSSSRSARWSRAARSTRALAALERARADLRRRARAAQGQAARRLGAARRRPCSAPPSSATTSTGR